MSDDGSTDTFVQSLSTNFDAALRSLEAALSACPDELWEQDLWPDEASMGPGPHGGLHGSAPWFLAHHALVCLDYDLTGGFEPWEAPAPFDERVYAWPARVFTRHELLSYVEACRERVRSVLEGLTPEAAARPLARGHRYQGKPFGVLLGDIPLHVTEHASQIRQFARGGGPSGG